MKKVFLLVGLVLAVGAVGVQAQSKQELVTKMNEQICLISNKRIGEMNTKVKRMGVILTKVEARTGKQAEASDALAAASKAVSDQVTKTCTVAVTSDAAAKWQMGAAVKMMQGNFKTIDGKLETARRAVMQSVSKYGQKK